MFCSRRPPCSRSQAGAAARPACRTAHGRGSGLTPSSLELPLSIPCPSAANRRTSMRTDLRARRTLSEGFLNALSIKTGRRPSMAEDAQNVAMDAAESQSRAGQAILPRRCSSALVAPRDQLEGPMLPAGRSNPACGRQGCCLKNCIMFPTGALLHLQPGGDLFPRFADGPRSVLRRICKSSSRCPPAG